MRILFKVLLIPFALLFSLFSFLAYVIGGYAACLIRLAAGFLWFGVMCIIGGGMWMNGSVDWTLAVSVFAITSVITLLAVFFETLPAMLATFSALVWSL